MRPPFLLLVSLLAPADPASAQVTVDLRALDALPASRPAITRPAPTPAPRTRPQTASATAGTNGMAAHGGAAAPAAQASAAPTGAASAASGSRQASAAASAAPTSGTAAPPPAATLPSGAPPAEPTGAASPTFADASPTPAAAEAPSGPVAAAVRVMFAPGQGELGADGTSVIKELVASAPKGDGTTFNVVAYAAPTPDDPSTARRLSLSRALAVRNVLMAAGVPSSRIYVRALGGQAGDGPADRADVSVLGGNSPPPASAKPQ